MAKAVIYVRVSDQRQVVGNSLANQEAACREWCLQNGIEVARVFNEPGHSARDTDRPEFQAMFRFVERNRKDLSHMVIDRQDRFSRDYDAGAVYRIMLKRLGIALVFVKEPAGNSPLDQAFMRMNAVMAQADNETKAIRSIDGMKASVRAGRWVWVAPLGYKNGRVKTEPSLFQDAERVPMIAKFFELVAEGKKLHEALDHVSAMGLRTRTGEPVPVWTAKKWLSSPVYCGIVASRAWGMSVKGDFQPIITEQLFQRVQDVLSGRSPVAVAHRRLNPKFPLRGTLLCPACHLPATGSTSGGKTKKFSYYHCHRKPRHFRKSSEDIDAAFLGLLDRLQPSPSRQKLMGEVFRRVWNEKQAGADAELKTLWAQEKRLEEEKRRLVRVMVNPEESGLEVNDLKPLLQEVKSQLVEVKSRLDIATRKVIDVDTALGYLTHLYWNSSNIWSSNDLEGKRRLAKLLFPKGIEVSKTGFGTPATHSLYTLLADEALQEESMVRPERFELPT